MGHLPPLYVLLARLDPAVIYSVDGIERTFYPCREGVYIPWTLEDGLWLPWDQHPPLPEFQPNVVFLDDSWPRTITRPSSDPADLWKGEDATEEIDACWRCFIPGYTGILLAMHPDLWANWSESDRIKLEPYEVRLAADHFGTMIRFLP